MPVTLTIDDCDGERHRMTLLPDDVEFPDGDHDVELEESLVALGAPRPECLWLRRAWLGQRTAIKLQGYEPLPYARPLAFLHLVIDNARAAALARREEVPSHAEARIRLSTDFLQHILDQAGVAEEYLAPAYMAIHKVRNKVIDNYSTTTALLRAAAASALRTAEVNRYSKQPAAEMIAKLNRAANYIARDAIDTFSHDQQYPGIHARTARARSAAIKAFAMQTRDSQQILDELIWQRHHALKVYESLMEGKPWPSV